MDSNFNLELLSLAENCTFYRFPDEIIAQILRYLDPSELQLLRKVSLRWNNVIQNYFQISVQITNRNWAYLQSTGFVRHASFLNWTRDFGPQQILVLPPSTLTLSTSPEDLDLENLDHHPPQLLTQHPFTSSLFSLEIHNPDVLPTHYNLFPLLKSCTKLTKLTLKNIIEVRPGSHYHDVSLDDPYWVASSSSWYPNLETFKFVDSWPSKVVSGGGDASNECCQHKLNLLKFLFKSFTHTRLRRIELILNNSLWWLPFHRLMHVTDSELNMVNLIEQNYHQGKLVPLPIEELNSQTSNRTQSLESIKIEWNDVNLIEFALYPEELRSTDDVHGAGGCRQIRHFSKISKLSKSPKRKNPRIKASSKSSGSNFSLESPINFFEKNERFLKFWWKLLNLQLSLESLTYELFLEDYTFSMSQLKEVLSLYYVSLQSLILIYRPRSSIPQASGPRLSLNLDTFQNLKHLVLISIPCRKISSLDQLDSDSDSEPQIGDTFLNFVPLNNLSLLVNLGKLPSTLKRLELHCPFYVEELNFSSIFGRLTSLKILKFISSDPFQPWFITRNKKALKEVRQGDKDLYEARGQIFLLKLAHIDNIIGSLPKLDTVEIYHPKIDLSEGPVDVLVPGGTALIDPLLQTEFIGRHRRVWSGRPGKYRPVRSVRHTRDTRQWDLKIVTFPEYKYIAKEDVVSPILFRMIRIHVQRFQRE